MSRKEQYRDLMERIRQSHQEFDETWSRVRTAELRRLKVDPRAETRGGVQMEKVWKANGVAYEASHRQSARLHTALGVLFDGLPFEDFLVGKPEAIDAILDFLEIDVLAFRCGYVKQLCFHKLKSLTVNQEQIIRLRQLALAMCRYKGQRREMRELARLMIKLADKPLVEDLQEIATSDDNQYTRKKASRMLGVILHSRHDLQ